MKPVRELRQSTRRTLVTRAVIFRPWMSNVTVAPMSMPPALPLHAGRFEVEVAAVDADDARPQGRDQLGPRARRLLDDALHAVDL
ncbi:MAG TPA: hypothetical protein VEQ42_10975, partial [Pyrinomonadaceae bacterium]|nr:hypothetical protein [Pyrinomonadaceae bacterium]